MITDIKKNEFLRRLGANRPRDVSLPVVRAIIDHLDPILGVDSLRYEKYAEVSATGLRTVARTVPALHRHGLVQKKSRCDGPPVLWLPELMDMPADEALRRAGWLAHHKDENPQNYFGAVDANVAERAHARRASKLARDEIDAEGEPKTTHADNPSRNTGTQLKVREQRRTRSKSPAHANDQEILRLVHSEWDAQGLTPEDPQALTKAIHATGNSRPQRLKHMDGRALRKAYQRARARLPVEYDHWIDLVERWDKSYNRQKARGLVDRLVTAIGSNRPDKIAKQMFDHLVRQFSGSGKKKTQRLESECKKLEEYECYIPQLRELKRDEDGEQVLGALVDGPKTRKQLARKLQRTLSAISTIGTRLKKTGQVKSIVRCGRILWARRDYPAPHFVLARASIVQALQKGPMNVSALVQETGKARSTVETALRRHLLPNHEVIRIKFGTYALPGTHQPYIYKRNLILPVLEARPMTVAALAQATGTPLSSIYQSLRPLLDNGKVIRIKHGIYALPGTEPVYVTTSDAIVSALTRRPMELGAVVQHINRRTNISRSRNTVNRILAYLKQKGAVKQDRRGGEYHLARRLHACRGAQSTARRKVAR